jgi:hypothetical protein
MALYMVIERFKDGKTRSIGERFKKHGRMLPEGVSYHAGWVEKSGRRCFQLMDAPSLPLMLAWTKKWEDLVDFEIVPVVTSADFWAARA